MDVFLHLKLLRISGVHLCFGKRRSGAWDSDRQRIIKEGDIVSLDAGVIYEGYHSDAARTVAVGEVSEEAKLLIERTRQSFIEGMKKQWLEIIFMIFPQQLVTMQISLDMEWSRIFVDMELEAIFMKNRRSRISDSHGFAEELS